MNDDHQNECPLLTEQIKTPPGAKPDKSAGELNEGMPHPSPEYPASSRHIYKGH